jgi:adenosylcobinamide kinase/adenosylcobinamide-phosphate guanylyltransferase
MGRIILVIGAARSGKSGFAVKKAKGLAEEVVFLAPCLPKDEEMKERILLHKKNRPLNWQTIEGDIDIKETLKSLNPKTKVVILDCLTIFISNLILKDLPETKILNQVQEIIRLSLSASWQTIIVSNEVGAGIVPKYKLARNFRDITGKANQMVAKSADEVFLLVAGLPLKIKGGVDGNITKGD